MEGVWDLPLGMLHGVEGRWAGGFRATGYWGVGGVNRFFRGRWDQLGMRSGWCLVDFSPSECVSIGTMFFLCCVLCRMGQLLVVGSWLDVAMLGYIVKAVP